MKVSTACICVTALLCLCIVGVQCHDCFPDNSGFQAARCTCERSLCAQGEDEREINCESTSFALEEFPVLLTDKNYTEVVCLKAKGQEFTEIRKDHLDKFPNLRYLDLSGGKVSRIYNDAFENNRHLELIDLSANHLTNFPPVRNLTKLEFLYVKDNDIQSLEPGDLDQCYTLSIIDATNNDIKELKYGVFRDQCSLHVLRLGDNKRLSSIENDVFENTALRELNLDNTAIDHLPSKGLRQYLRELFMSGTRNLKRFDAYEAGIEFNNQTYPLLEKVEFFYHAHCCQMQNHHYFVLGRRRQVEEKSEYLVTTADSHAGDYKREASQSMDGYVCVNTTGGDVVNVNNITDFQIQTASEFCASEHCFASLCGDGCTASTEGLSSAMGAMDTFEIICVEIVPSLSLDKYYSSESFSSQITKNICNTTPLSVIPVPSPTISPSSSTTPTSPTPLILPLPPDPCKEPVEWCLHEYTDHYVDSCDTCASFECSFIPSCEGDFPELCDCYKRKRSAYEQNSLREQNFKRSVNTTYPDCFLSITDVMCRKRLKGIASTLPYAVPSLAPTSSPSLMSNPCESPHQCDHDYSIGELLLPSGWFYPDLDSKDTICREVSENVMEPTPTPTPTPSVPSTVSPQNECIRNTHIIRVDVTTLVEGPLTECSPEPNDFNPCEDLLGDSDILRVAIWFVVILALFGNGFVIFVFFGYSVVIRRTKMNLFIMHFLYANLAVADLLMGVYLLTIAAVDVHTLGHFSEEDVEWRTGPGCGFAGFCAITSTMVSVYTLVAISFERFSVLVLGTHCKTQRAKWIALAIIVIGWVFGIVMAILPLVGISSYDTVPFCLPFDVTTTRALTYVTSLLVITGLAYIAILLSYLITCIRVLSIANKYKLLYSNRKDEIIMAFRVFLIIITNFICWFPIALVSLTAAFGAPLNGISVGTAKIFVVFVFPLNACINPILYSLSTKAFWKNFNQCLSRHMKCKKHTRLPHITGETSVTTPAALNAVFFSSSTENNEQNIGAKELEDLDSASRVDGGADQT